MISSPSSDAGYIPLDTFIAGIEAAQKRGQWKFPFTLTDRLHLWVLKQVVKFSVFKRLLYVEHDQTVSPAFALLLGFLKKKKIMDVLYERELHSKGYHSFFIQKSLHSNGKEQIVYGQGASPDRETALSIAMGEMLERSIAGWMDKNKNIIVDAPIKLEKNTPIVYPPKYHRFLDIQKEKYPDLQHDPSVPMRWVYGRNLVTQELTLIPRHMTSWLDERRNSIPGILVHPTTNGSAGYFTKQGAALRGLLEVVQRDGFMCHWLTSIPPEIILIDSLPIHLQEKVKAFEEFGISINILNTASLSIPSVIIVATNPHAETPRALVCGGTGLTFERAIANGLRETVLSLESFYSKKTFSELDGIDQIIEPFVSNLDKTARILYWEGAERMHEFEWFMRGEKIHYASLEPQNLPTHTEEFEELSTCIRALKQYGKAYFPVVYYPVNPIQEKLGFFIAQVYIPMAFPLYLIEKYGTFDSDRLQEFAESKKVKDWKLNPQPHMFP